MRRTLLLASALCLALVAPGLCAKTKAPKGPKYQVTDLGTLGGSWSRASDINDRGQVVGEASCKPDATGYEISHAFLWDDGRMYDLGTPRKDQSSCAHAINNRGQVVGTGYDLDDGDQHPFLWQNGRMNRLAIPYDLGCEAMSISDSGRIALVADVHPYFDAYLLDKRMTMRVCKQGCAYGINNEGVVVGNCESQAFAWYGGSMLTLGSLGGSWSTACSVNNKGQVVGYGETPPMYTGPVHAFIWQDGKLTDLGLGQALDINDLGQVVGFSETDLAILWDNGTKYLLNDQIPSNSGWSLVSVCGINNHGDIVGWGWYKGEEHAVLLTPK